MDGGPLTVANTTFQFLLCGANLSLIKSQGMEGIHRSENPFSFIYLNLRISIICNITCICYTIYGEFYILYHLFVTMFHFLFMSCLPCTCYTMLSFNPFNNLPHIRTTTQTEVAIELDTKLETPCNFFLFLNMLDLIR
jgi:hypothetical protein